MITQWFLKGHRIHATRKNLYSTSLNVLHAAIRYPYNVCYHPTLKAVKNTNLGILKITYNAVDSMR